MLQTHTQNVYCTYGWSWQQWLGECHNVTLIAYLDGVYDHFTSASWLIDMILLVRLLYIMNLKGSLHHKFLSGGLVMFLTLNTG
jgi:hypothetical protein